jgi:catechol 2,3-dioxygenase-like lactoylglutathione lyase family enzyme
MMASRGSEFTRPSKSIAGAESPDGLLVSLAEAFGVTEILGLDHVQLAMPAGMESTAREFYVGVLGLVEEAKPPHLAARGGVWFRGGTLRLHLGVDADFRAARKAHPAISVRGLSDLSAKCQAAGFPPITDEPLAGFSRVYVFDPFGNRIELLEQV